MGKFDEHYEFRDGVKASVIRDLIGPGRHDEVRLDEEVLGEAPMTRYIAGVLYGQSSEAIEAVNDNDRDDVAGAGKDDATDSPVAMANLRYPSAMAISIGVDVEMSKELAVAVTGARYVREDDEEGNERWTRVPLIHSEPVTLAGRAQDQDIELPGDLKLFIRERTPDDRGHTAVTVALVNQQKVPPGEWRKDEYSVFQTELRLTSPAGDVFVDRTKVDVVGADDDADSFNLLYRHAPAFAVGHGCGANWEQGEDASRASAVHSTFSPSHELLLADNNPDVTSPYFSMRRLAEADRADVVAGLRIFVSDYRLWIDGRREDSKSLEEGMKATAGRHMLVCDDAASRIEAGIALLSEHDDVWLAFQLANRAMLVQRARSDWMREGGSGEPDLETDRHSWHAFQIGFILMTLRGIAEPEHDDRDLVDLLWFPTGGGKTEAYLGLIAFTVFLRRIRAAANGGTGAGLTVIMRYTLRLLTLQQFQRAAILMCACESIRRSRSDLGEEEISIGLWVGQGSTPNKLKDAKESLAALAKGKMPETQNPVQLLECPWCAVPLSHDNYWVKEGGQKRLMIQCKNPACEFEKGLPAFVVDEDIDRYRPTLMIATVDKFAALPWRDHVGPLFGSDSEEGPPELIIQDELHLISGPLGTMVGLYETAISWLCTSDGIGPKVIASTATIRRADDQIKQLYGAKSFQFPPPGIDARNSFFAVEADRDSKGTRTYVGLLAPASSHTTLMIRTYAAALQTASELDGTDEVRDPYWTMLGYFNSLRVLGGALLQVRDDVVDRVAVLASTNDTTPRFDGTSLTPPIEMTSRIASSKIPLHLELMSTALPDENVQDVVLATNMISVGVDIDRLGLMAVMGQPQSASEYIQATSRIGRKHPGLVFTLLSANKSRDRSHYEDFVAFHSSLYRRVDASSVTPFAARARDRALHAVFIGMLRARVPEFRANASARNVAELDLLAQPVIDLILDRVRRVDPSELAGTEESLLRLIKNWKRKAGEADDLRFSNPFDPPNSLLSDAGRPELAEQHDSLSTMWSLRAVDTESELYLI